MVRGCTLLRVLEAERLALICSVAFSGDHLQLKELLLIGDANRRPVFDVSAFRASGSFVTPLYSFHS